MKRTAVLLARVPLIRFRHGQCNAGNAAPPPKAPGGGKGGAPPAPAPPAPRGSPKPLGPNVTVQMVASLSDLPEKFHRKPISAEEMEMVDLGGAVDPPPKKDKKKK
mmetsp:Transcript_18916/g.47729  ORF Transcript_18916/g.47729 Transcript_18916/m.47729 type:complete len:106 (-) Transcript_18916:31-348(-)